MMMEAKVFTVAESRKLTKRKMPLKSQGLPMSSLRVTNHMAIKRLTPEAVTAAAKMRMNRIMTTVLLPKPSIRTWLMLP